MIPESFLVRATEVTQWGCHLLQCGSSELARCGSSRHCGKMPAMEVEADSRRTRAAPWCVFSRRTCARYLRMSGGQLSPAAWKRLTVARTVDAATPIRRAISPVDTPPTNLSRSTSRTWRMVVLSAGIRSLLRKSKGADLSRPAEAPAPRARSSRNGGRHHLGTVGEIISERWAASSWNGGRLQPESAQHGRNVERRVFH